MKLKGLVDEDFLQYKIPSMFIITCNCDFKCEKECGKKLCQNSAIVELPVIELDDDELIERYIANNITKAIVFGGLEPILQFDEIVVFIDKLRNHCNIMDDVVIYTGYNEEEIHKQIEFLKIYPNIVIKFGRFIPDEIAHRDGILGIELASDNQYAKRIS